jgi:hypothetical protein
VLPEASSSALLSDVFTGDTTVQRRVVHP